MSYCRLSDDNWKSDVYAYESASGYELHVAAYRLVGDIPEVPYILDVTPEEWGAAHKAQMTAVSAAKRVPIGGVRDGASYTYDTLEDLHRALLDLRSNGYHVPQFALDEIEEEMNNVPK